MVQVTCSSGGGHQVVATPVYAQAYVEAAGSGARKALLVNTRGSPQDVTFPGAAGGQWAYVDESTGFGPAATVTLQADTWTLQPFALGVLHLA